MEMDDAGNMYMDVTVKQQMDGWGGVGSDTKTTTVGE